MPPHDLQWIASRGTLRLNAAPLLYRCEPIWSWKAASLPDFALLLILDGRGEMTVDGQLHSLRQGLCFFLKPGSRVEAQQNHAYPLFLFLARFEILDRDAEPLTLGERFQGPLSVFIRNTRSLETLAELIASRNDAQAENDPLLQDALAMLLRLLVEEATRRSGYFDPRAYEALRAIENDLARKWSVAALAREAELSPSAFARCFRRMMNEPPIHYVVRRRMEEAKRQIQQSSLPIEEIAINLGYNDLGFFRELFRKRIGCLPEALRANRGF